MTAVVQPAYVCDEAEARTLTDQIKGSVEKTWRLLLNAHEWKAWAALGYGSWRDYAMDEFGLSQSAAYRMLDMARVIREIESAGSFPDLGKNVVTPQIAADLKPHLDEVVDAVRDAVTGLPEDERPAAAAQAVTDARARLAPPRPRCSPPAVSAPAESTSFSQPPAGGEPSVDLTGVVMTREQFLAQRRTGEVVAPPTEPADPVAAACAEAEDDLAAHMAETDARYLVNLFRGVTSANTNLLALDPQRAVDTCRDLPDERDSLLAFLTRVQSWSDHVRAGLRPALRSVR